MRIKQELYNRYHAFEMNIHNYIIILVLIFSLSSCKNEKNRKKTNKITKNTTTDLQVDHLNIWVKNPKRAKKRLIDIGFTSVPDSLSQIHIGQGTAGKYFHFLNGYLELIFVYDQNELEENNLKNNSDLVAKTKQRTYKYGLVFIRKVKI